MSKSKYGKSVDECGLYSHKFVHELEKQNEEMKKEIRDLEKRIELLECWGY